LRRRGSLDIKNVRDDASGEQRIPATSAHFVGSAMRTCRPNMKRWSAVRTLQNPDARDRPRVITEDDSMMHTIAVHPGAVLLDELEERGITQKLLATHIGVLSKTVNEICREKRGISAEMAVKLSLALGASPQFWLNLQKNWELSQVKRKAVGRIKPIAA